MRFIMFNDKKIDSMLFMELQDLATTLTRDESWQIEYRAKSYVDLAEKQLYLSHFWDHRGEAVLRAGLKTDVYLRTLGSLALTDHEAMKRLFMKLASFEQPKLWRQLALMLEEVWLERVITKQRPGTKRAFQLRREQLNKYYDSQLTVHVTKSVFTDAFFNWAFLVAHAERLLEERPPLRESLQLALPYVERELQTIHDAATTDDVARIVVNIADVIDELLDRDMLNEYFAWPDAALTPLIPLHDIKRVDEMASLQCATDEESGNEEVFEQKMDTWNRETEKRGEAFMHMELNEGTNSSIIADTARQGEDQDAAMAMAHGSANATERKQFGQQSLDRTEDDDKRGGAGGQTGINARAELHYYATTSVTADEKRQYAEYEKAIAPFRKKLQQVIEKTLLHKQTNPTTNLQMGRLSRQLPKLWTEKLPRIFYKKTADSKEIDAVFTLLVDCSASMYDKMDETKKGVILFHEVLKHLKVKHQVLGFWEDTDRVSEDVQPNYLHEVISLQSSVYASGETIMQLEPREDNRDGYIIREVVKQLRATEAQKFLLIFSDGEPAAFQYEQGGIIDTHEAVLEARKQGIEVINIFLSRSEIEESQKKTLHNIYGNFSVLVPDVEQLPLVLFPLLKRLLLKVIQ